MMRKSKIKTNNYNKDSKLLQRNSLNKFIEIFIVIFLLSILLFSSFSSMLIFCFKSICCLKTFWFDLFISSILFYISFCSMFVFIFSFKSFYVRFFVCLKYRFFRCVLIDFRLNALDLMTSNYDNCENSS